MKRNSLQMRFILIFTGVFLLVALLAAFYSAYKTAGETDALVNEEVNNTQDKIMGLLEVSDDIMAKRVQNSMRLLKQRGMALGRPEQKGDVDVNGVTVPDLWLGNYPQGNNFNLLDDLTEIMDGTATIFSRSGNDYIRIATNVVKNGKRAIGTKLSPSGKAIKKIANNQAYYGQVDILGMPYLTAYEPIMNPSGDNIGIWYVGYSADIDAVESSIRKTRILSKGFVALLDAKKQVRAHSDNHDKKAIEQILANPGSDWQLNRFDYEPWQYQLVVASSNEEARQISTLSAIYTIAAILTGGAILLGILVIVMKKIISDPIQGYLTAITDVAEGEGDLTVQFSVDRQDELGQMAQAFNKLFERLRRNINDVADQVTDLQRVTVDLEKTAAKSTIAAQQTRKSSGSIAASVDEISQVAGSVSNNANTAGAAANEAKNQTSTSLAALDSSTDSVTQQNQELNKSMKVLTELSKSSENIGGVMDVISGIAEQTNLLALNAAIEAARAGEQGRGFAVVADEVRALASRTQESTTNIRDMISQLQNGSNTACEMIERNQQISAEGVDRIAEAGRNLSMVKQRVAEIANLSLDSEKAAQQQQSYTQTLTDQVNLIDNASEENLQQSEWLQSLTGELTNISTTLDKVVSTFKT